MTNNDKLSRTTIRNGKYLTWYQWTYQGVLTEDEAGIMQMDNGYNPCGYGFYSFNVKDGVTTWLCSNSCD